MKRIALSIVAACLAWQSGAAEGGWLTDFSKAKAQAKAEKKLVLMDFAGSDWCPPCKALYRNVLSKPEFAEYAKKNLVLLDVDFPKQKAQAAEQKKANKALAEKFDVDGFPTIIVLNSEGKQLSKKTGYGGQSVKDFIAELEKIKSRS